ncbi:MAG: adenylate/guanylate cyclase domain-containing protein [Sneathiellaceae bacterium]
MDVQVWLRELGLEQYGAAFRDNAIDGSVLPDLTGDDLKELGVGAIGHRRKLLTAIAALGADAQAPAPGDRAALPSAAAERRQVTVMFSDLAGSTALSARMDPEDLREIISGYQRCVAESVGRFGGYVAKYMGDGVLIYFGYPQAQEDDAERAVRAGLDIVARVAGLDAGTALHSRVGIATGLVVVGDLIGSGESRERGIVGETPNLAARLQGIAEPDTVVLADSTRRLLGGLFALSDLGATALKGIGEPVRAWQAMHENATESRFEAMRGTARTALIGREAECRALLERWSQARDGLGQAVLLSGEAGIGKSRLTAFLMEELRTERQLRYFCSPQHTDSPLHPFIRQLEHAAGFAREDPPQRKLDKLDALLRDSAAPAAETALFAGMLSLPSDGRHPAPPLTAQQRRQATFGAIVRLLEARAAGGPVLIVFEDAHWIDPTSLELLGRVIERIPNLPALLLVTARPEFEAPWAGRKQAIAIALGRLARQDIEAMVDRLAGGGMPAKVRREIMDRTDGIPLFVEEMTKAVLEAGREDRGARSASPARAAPLEVPASLHASLMARLDRLGPAKEVAQIGAAIGREVSQALLARVSPMPPAALQSALDRLTAAGLLFRQGEGPGTTYLFNHALVQDAAYGTLLREPRRALHARIVEALETAFPAVAGNQPELLARHATAAGLVEKAAAFWGRAGEKSLAQSALQEAAEQLARALEQLGALPPSAARRREAIRLQIQLANALIHTSGHASPEAKAAFDRARRLVEQVKAMGEEPEDPLVPFSVLYGFWVASRMAFQGEVVRELAAQFLALADRQQGSVPRMVGHLLLGISLALTGEAEAGRSHLDRTVALYEPGAHRSLGTRFGHDVRVTAFSWRSLASWMLDEPDAAREDAAHALADAREIGHAASLMFALSHTSLALAQCGDREAACALADELAVLAGEKGATYWQAYGDLVRASLLALEGQHAGSLDLAAPAIAAMRATGATAYAPWYLSCCARSHAQTGQLQDARRCLDEAFAALDATGETWWAPEVHRIAGEIALLSARPDRTEAEGHFQRALSVARDQGARSLERRAAESLARLHDGAAGHVIAESGGRDA